MTDKRNHQSDEVDTPGLVPATQPGDPGAASSKLANTSPRAAPGTVPIPLRYIYGLDA